MFAAMIRTESIAITPEILGLIAEIDEFKGAWRALGKLAAIEREARSGTLRDMALAGMLVAAAAWRRTESRGGHFRSDFPAADPGQAHRNYITASEAVEIAARAEAKAA